MGQAASTTDDQPTVGDQRPAPAGGGGHPPFADGAGGDRDVGRAIVIDSGSAFTRAGFAGDDAPRGVLLSQLDPSHNDPDVGRESPKLPISRGIVTNWDDMEKLWARIFRNDLRVNPEQHPVLLTDPPLNPKGHRETMARIMFDVFNIPAMILVNQAALALLASRPWDVAAATTGVVVCSGAGVSHTVPVVEGYALPHATLRLNVAGDDLTAFLKQLLEDRGFSLPDTIATDIKEKLCYTAGDFSRELERDAASTEANYELPSGEVITLGSERFRLPEVMFRPSLFGLKTVSVHSATCYSIMECDLDLRKDMFANIVLAGGNTRFEGFAERLQKELSALAPAMTIEVVALQGRQELSWRGGSQLGELFPASSHGWVSRQDYLDIGPSVVNRKCF